MKKFFIVLFLLAALQASAQQQVLIENVRIFDGKNEKTTIGNVLIEGNLIKQVSTSPITAGANTQAIDGKGYFLMPGLIDAHAHTTMDAMHIMEAMTSDIGYINLYSAPFAEQQLLRGFTSVRDVGGNPFSLKKAIDRGVAVGPRIYPSGAMISQTGGHGDFRSPTEVPKPCCGALTYLESAGMTMLADGRNEILLRVREQLRQGATQIKIAAGGGVASDYDPLDVAQYTEDEIRAAVECADNWGTYVTVHAYTPKAIQAAIRAGGKGIEHGQLVDESTAKMIAEKGVWWCIQPFLDDEDAIPFPAGSPNREKQLEMTNGTEAAYKLAKKYKIKTAFGTDCLFDAQLTTRQGAQLAKLTKWYTPFEVLKMATSTNGELLAMCGKRNPYPHPLGVIEPGAYADLILVSGNPLENIKLIENPQENFVLIMKDGKIYKDNTASAK